MEQISFSDIAIVSCGNLSIELNHLKNKGYPVIMDPGFTENTPAIPLADVSPEFVNDCG